MCGSTYARLQTEAIRAGTTTEAGGPHTHQEPQFVEPRPTQKTLESGTSSCLWINSNVQFSKFRRQHPRQLVELVQLAVWATKSRKMDLRSLPTGNLR
jgi:hypothetical protein